MNTSNFEPSNLTQQGFTQKGSLPDIAQLSKLANELFTALPCDGSRDWALLLRLCLAA